MPSSGKRTRSPLESLTLEPSFIGQPSVGRSRRKERLELAQQPRRIVSLDGMPGVLDLDPAGVRHVRHELVRVLRQQHPALAPADEERRRLDLRCALPELPPPPIPLLPPFLPAGHRPRIPLPYQAAVRPLAEVEEQARAQQAA